MQSHEQCAENLGPTVRLTDGGNRCRVFGHCLHLDHPPDQLALLEEPRQKEQSDKGVARKVPAVWHP